jgi:MFS family permease
MFLAAGLGFGIWAGNIPVLKQRFELSGSALSIILLAVAAGSIVSMPIAGQAVRHFGSRRCVAVSLGCYALCLAFLALAPNLFLFVASALLFGGAKASVEVGINAQAIVVERDYGPLLLHRSIVNFAGYPAYSGLPRATQYSATPSSIRRPTRRTSKLRKVLALIV